jgi:hypothetical protein
LLITFLTCREETRTANQETTTTYRKAEHNAREDDADIDTIAIIGFVPSVAPTWLIVHNAARNQCTKGQKQQDPAAPGACALFICRGLGIGHFCLLRRGYAN